MWTQRFVQRSRVKMEFCPTMKSKFIIVNNGMTELRGHYYETGISVAREAEKRGFHTAMATHAAFDDDALPGCVDFYPLFRVDHWAVKVVAEVPGFHGLRGCLSALRKTTIEDVLAGAATIEQYLVARLEPFEVASSEMKPISRRARIKQIARRVVPPIAVPAARWLLRSRDYGTRVARALISPFLYDRVKLLLRSSVHANDAAVEQARSAVNDSGQISFDSQVEMNLSNALSRTGADLEGEVWQLFFRDLDRLLCLADVGPADHVFLPTAHAREAYAIRRLIEEIGEEQSPTFHLEFRHPISTLDELESGNANPGTLLYTRIHQAFFDACRAYADTSSMRFYTDTDLLADDYARLGGFEFRVLPIPFRADLIPPPSAPCAREGPLKILFLGDVREEKGFLLLPGLVRSLYDNYVKTGRLRFVVQATIHPDQTSSPLQDAVAELEGYGTLHVELIGRNGFLEPHEYYAALANSDIVLCPYLADCYRARSSGILTEAIVAGKPTVVQAGSWLARQQEPGSGETFSDLASLASAVQSICERYQQYAARARVAQGKWRQNHSPARLLDCLLGARRQARFDAA
jgi:hypothetical protein